MKLNFLFIILFCSCNQQIELQKSNKELLYRSDYPKLNDETPDFAGLYLATFGTISVTKMDGSSEDSSITKEDQIHIYVSQSRNTIKVNGCMGILKEDEHGGYLTFCNGENYDSYGLVKFMYIISDGYALFNNETLNMEVTEYYYYYSLGGLYATYDIAITAEFDSWLTKRVNGEF